MFGTPHLAVHAQQERWVDLEELEGKTNASLAVGYEKSVDELAANLRARCGWNGVRAYLCACACARAPDPLPSQRLAGTAL
eukprot:scaffold41744_cov62-Phaeocystis_antarctica.AAC.4